MVRCLLVVLSVFVLSTFGFSQTFTPNEKPSVTAPKISEKIMIDGNLDESSWKMAAHAENFMEQLPNDRTQPPVKTDVLLMYDDQNLYIAFIAEQNPKEIRAGLRDRDEISQDDYVGILLDTYGNAAWYYQLYFNPLGIQGDAMVTMSGDDDGFDIIHDSYGKITDKGYQVEIAIPFKSLRFPDKEEQIWRATFIRDHKRETRARYSWAATQRGETCDPCQFGFITGIKNINPGHSFELLPAFVATQSGNINNPNDKNSGFTNHDVLGSLSLSAKYSLSSSVTAEATYNPDFSQVESDANQIDINTPFALFYPERRPFFQEGSDLYGSFLSLVYTRSVNKPQFAVKVTGRPDRTSFVYFLANDQDALMLIPMAESSAFIPAGKTFVNNFRIKQAIFEDSYIGATVTDRRYDIGGSNSVFSIDGMIRLSENWRLSGQYALAVTEEANDTNSIAMFGTMTFGRNGNTVALDGEKFNGNALSAGLAFNTRLIDFNLNSSQTNPEFRADNGFIVKNDTRQVDFNTTFNWYTNTKLIEVVRPNIFGARVWNYAGTRKDEWIALNLFMNLIGETYFSSMLMGSNEQYNNHEFQGIKRINLSLSSNYFYPLSFGLNFTYGHTVKRFGVPYLGKSADWGVSATYKPILELTISPDFSYSQMIHPITGEFAYKAYTFRLLTKYQFTRELSLRLVIQEYFDRNYEFNSFNQGLSFEPLISYKLNPLSIFYIGATLGGKRIISDVNYYPNSPTFASAVNFTEYTKVSQQFFMKFQYLFQL